MEEVQGDSVALAYNERLLKDVEKLKNRSCYYTNLSNGSRIYNASTGIQYNFLVGSKYEKLLWKVICSDRELALYYDSPEEWVRHRKKLLRFDKDDLDNKENVILWVEPSEEEVYSMKEKGKKKIPKYVPTINPKHKEVWEARSKSLGY